MEHNPQAQEPRDQADTERAIFALTNKLMAVLRAAHEPAHIASTAVLAVQAHIMGCMVPDRAALLSVHARTSATMLEAALMKLEARQEIAAEAVAAEAIRKAGHA